MKRASSALGGLWCCEGCGKLGAADGGSAWRRGAAREGKLTVMVVGLVAAWVSEFIIALSSPSFSSKVELTCGRPPSLSTPKPLCAGAARGTACSVSTAITQGIRVNVSTVYVPSQSSPTEHRYVFAYTIRITNEGTTTATLRSRHWIIKHGSGRVEEVRGPGVVGQQPVLEPGRHFEYTSGCVLESPRGTMRGTYQMIDKNGRTFDADIAEFTLSMPHSLN